MGSSFPPDIKETDPHSITSEMVGSQYVDEDVYVPRPLGDTILELEGYTGQGFNGIDLDVKRGEVVAFTGLAGCGASELMQTMFGALPAQGGTMRVNGRSLEGSIVRFMKNGVAMLAANRKENSVVPDMSIMENFYLAEHELSGKKPFISKKRRTAATPPRRRACTSRRGTAPTASCPCPAATSRRSSWPGG